MGKSFVYPIPCSSMDLAKYPSVPGTSSSSENDLLRKTSDLFNTLSFTLLIIKYVWLRKMCDFREDVIKDMGVPCMLSLLHHLLWGKPVVMLWRHSSGPMKRFMMKELKPSDNGHVSEPSWKQILKSQLSLQMIVAQADILMTTS